MFVEETMTDANTVAPDEAPLRILLLEDEPPLRERFARILDEWPGGELVAACATLGEALAQLPQQPVDLLMTDLNLPDGSGIEAIALLGKLYPDADAMVISVLADDEMTIDRKSTRLNSSHVKISYAVFCLKKKIVKRLGARC